MINQAPSFSNPNSSVNNRKVKIIKRYENRKLYNTQQSCYVTLDDLAKMIRANEEIIVMDNKTKSDITAATLIMIIFESERRESLFAPTSILSEIIQHGNGSLSSYLAKLGAFPQDYFQQKAALDLAQSVSADLQKSSEHLSKFEVTREVVGTIFNGPVESANLPKSISGENDVQNLPTSKLDCSFIADRT